MSSPKRSRCLTVGVPTSFSPTCADRHPRRAVLDSRRSLRSPRRKRSFWPGLNIAAGQSTGGCSDIFTASRAAIVRRGFRCLSIGKRLPQGTREWNLKDMRMLPQMLAAGGLELRREEKILAYSDCAARALANNVGRRAARRWHRSARPAWSIASHRHGGRTEGRRHLRSSGRLTSFGSFSQDYPDQLSSGQRSARYGKALPAGLAREQLR